MMEQFKINEIIYRYIADAVSCTVEQLQQEGTLFVMNEKRTKEYIKVLSIKDTNIISLSEDKYEIGKSLLTGKNRDELYESSLIFGQTIHYVPDVKNMQMKPFPAEYTFIMYENHELVNLKGIKGFDNSLVFDENGHTDTNIVLCALQDDTVLAIASASYVTETIMEVGIDVKKEYRGRGLASLLVTNLTSVLLDKGKVPFYSASVTNLASQAVAVRSGYMPLWTDSYGVR